MSFGAIEITPDTAYVKFGEGLIGVDYRTRILENEQLEAYIYLAELPRPFPIGDVPEETRTPAIPDCKQVYLGFTNEASIDAVMLALDRLKLRYREAVHLKEVMQDLKKDLEGAAKDEAHDT